MLKPLGVVMSTTFYEPGVLRAVLLGALIGEALARPAPLPASGQLVEGMLSRFLRAWAAHLTELDPDRQAAFPMQQPDAELALLHLPLGTLARSPLLPRELPARLPWGAGRAPSHMTPAFLLYASRQDLGLLPGAEPVELPSVLKRLRPHAWEAERIARITGLCCAADPRRAARELQARCSARPALLWQAQALWAFCRVPGLLPSAAAELQRLDSARPYAFALLGALIGALAGMEGLGELVGRVPADAHGFIDMVCDIPSTGIWSDVLAGAVSALNRTLWSTASQSLRDRGDEATR